MHRCWKWGGGGGGGGGGARGAAPPPQFSRIGGTGGHSSDKLVSFNHTNTV